MLVEQQVFRVVFSRLSDSEVHRTKGDEQNLRCAKVVNYRLFAAGWISKVVVDQSAPRQRKGPQRKPKEQKEDPNLRQGERVEFSNETFQSAEPGEVQEVAADVLEQITSHSILYVMRPNLPLVDSHTLLSSLHSLPQLRQEAAALEHSYDLDLAQCYYTVRCAMYLIASCVEKSEVPGGDHQVIRDGILELDNLMSCIERSPLKVSVFLFLSSLCFARHHHLQNGQSVGAGENFLVPPNLLLSLLVLLRHHLQPLAAAEHELDPDLKVRIQQLQLFTQEAIWRVPACLAFLCPS